MARIRTIKPELCTDERFADCSPTARLLFVLLMPFCDDGGVHPAKIRTTRAEVFPLDDAITNADVEGWVRELIAAHLLGEFQAGGETYWFVCGWTQLQKIDKPSRKYPGPSDDGSTPIRRTLYDQSPNALGTVAEQPATPRRALGDSSPPEGRMEGVDTKGVEGVEFATTPDGDGSPAASRSKTSSPRKEPGRTSATWEAYSKAYLARYGAAPIRNQTINGQLAKFVDQLPAEEAPEVASFYIRSDDAFYVKALHPVNLLLRDVSKLRTEWFTGRTAVDSVGSRTRPRAPQDFTGVDYREGLNGGLLTS